jgi:hypothetical protein
LFGVELFGSSVWTQSFFASAVLLLAFSVEGRLVMDDVLHSVPSFGPPYLVIVPNVCAILWNSLSHMLESSKLPFIVMIPLGPSIFSMRYV